MNRNFLLFAILVSVLFVGCASTVHPAVDATKVPAWGNTQVVVKHLQGANGTEDSVEMNAWAARQQAFLDQNATHRSDVQALANQKVREEELDAENPCRRGWLLAPSFCYGGPGGTYDAGYAYYRTYGRPGHHEKYHEGNLSDVTTGRNISTGGTGTTGTTTSTGTTLTVGTMATTGTNATTGASVITGGVIYTGGAVQTGSNATTGGH